MSNLNLTLLIFQVINLTLFVTWIILAVQSLRQLRNSHMSDSVRLGWAIIILFIPVLGAVTFLSVRPGVSQPTA